MTDNTNAADELARLTGRDREEFGGDHEIPDFEDQEVIMNQNDTHDDGTDETVEHGWHMVEGDHFESFEVFLDDDGDDPDMFIFRSTADQLSELQEWVEERSAATASTTDDGGAHYP